MYRRHQDRGSQLQCLLPSGLTQELRPQTNALPARPPCELWDTLSPTGSPREFSRCTFFHRGSRCPPGVIAPLVVAMWPKLRLGAPPADWVGDLLPFEASTWGRSSSLMFQWVSMVMWPMNPIWWSKPLKTSQKRCDAHFCTLLIVEWSMIPCFEVGWSNQTKIKVQWQKMDYFLFWNIFRSPLRCFHIKWSNLIKPKLLLELGSQHKSKLHWRTPLYVSILRLPCIRRGPLLQKNP